MVLNTIQKQIKQLSIELIDCANNDTDIDRFNDLYDRIQSMKQIADEIEHEQFNQY